MKIGKHVIGIGQPVYIIAELSANHNQQEGEAVRLVKAAKEAGADAIKLQTYTADTLTIQCDRDEFKVGKGTLWEGRTLYDLYEEAAMPWEWQPKLNRIANDLDMDLFSTPFDKTAVDFLEAMDVLAYKVASFEIVDLGFIRTIAATRKPMILSTGMATLEEIHEAVDAARSCGASDIALLKCTSAYPAPPEEMNLRTIPAMQEEFNLPIGLSDHTLGTAVPATAVRLGACIVEKHFTLSRATPGPDSAFSLEPHEFKEMVNAIRAAERTPDTTEDFDETILGTVQYGPSGEERKSLPFRRSLFVVQDVQKGETFTVKHVRSIRPGYGLAPKHLEAVLGKQATQNIERGTPLSWELVAK